MFHNSRVQLYLVLHKLKVVLRGGFVLVGLDASHVVGLLQRECVRERQRQRQRQCLNACQEMKLRKDLGEEQRDKLRHGGLESCCCRRRDLVDSSQLRTVSHGTHTHTHTHKIESAH